MNNAIWVLYSVIDNAPGYCLSIMTYGLLWVYYFLFIILFLLCMWIHWFVWLFDVYLVCTVRYIAMDNELLCHSIPYLSGDNRAVCNASDTDSKQGIHSPVKSPRPNKSNAVSYLGLSHHPDRHLLQLTPVARRGHSLLCSPYLSRLDPRVSPRCASGPDKASLSSKPWVPPSPMTRSTVFNALKHPDKGK